MLINAIRTIALNVVSQLTLAVNVIKDISYLLEIVAGVRITVGHVRVLLSALSVPRASL